MTGWVDGFMNGWMDRCMDAWMDAQGMDAQWMDVWMHGWMHGCMDAWMDAWERSRKEGEFFGGSGSDKTKLRSEAGRDWAVGSE